MPRPSNASLQVPSERVFQSPLDFPNSLVCILEDDVSRGCTAKPEIRLLNTIHWTYSRKGLYSTVPNHRCLFVPCIEPFWPGPLDHKNSNTIQYKRNIYKNNNHRITNFFFIKAEKNGCQDMTHLCHYDSASPSSSSHYQICLCSDGFVPTFLQI